MSKLFRNSLILAFLISFIGCGGDEEEDQPVCNLSDANFSLSIVENADPGTAVGSVAISAPADVELSYTISAGNQGNTFTVDNEGMLTVNNNTLLDFEVNRQFDLLINVTGDGCNTASVIASIIVTNIRDALYADQYFNTINVTEDVPYGPNGGDQVMNLYLPEGADQAPRPVLVFAGGGAFAGSNLANLNTMARRFAGAGYVVALMRYISDPDDEMDPQERYILGLHDVKAAIRFFRKHADEGNAYNINPDNIFAGGYGTGAFLALQSTYAIADDYTEEQLELIDMFGGVEGERGNEGYLSNVNGVLNMAGAIFDLNMIDAGEPPLFSIHSSGDTEVACEEGLEGGVTAFGSCRIEDRVNDVNIPNELIVLPGTAHNAPINCTDCHDDAMRFFLTFIQ